MATGRTNAVTGSAEGIDLTKVTASASDVKTGRKFYDSTGTLVTGSVPVKTAATYTPGTADQSIAANQFLTGKQTIKGDSDLKASNIKAGVQIFGVTGTYSEGYDTTISGEFTATGGTSKSVLNSQFQTGDTLRSWTLSGPSGSGEIYFAAGLSGSGTGVCVTPSGPQKVSTSCSISSSWVSFSTESPGGFGNGSSYYYTVKVHRG